MEAYSRGNKTRSLFEKNHLLYVGRSGKGNYWHSQMRQILFASQVVQELSSQQGRFRRSYIIFWTWFNPWYSLSQSFRACVSCPGNCGKQRRQILSLCGRNSDVRRSSKSIQSSWQEDHFLWCSQRFEVFTKFRYLCNWQQFQNVIFRYTDRVSRTQWRNTRSSAFFCWILLGCWWW